ncbi:hypothetical protein BS47DRAFT_1302591 [Hydnum rufescens UP504]|uniref:Uncharacterized protein n=1 Tax=Hydnum rufescens UP504 TaxID=1448309 RepID=A0A9P6AMW8_9AGAM|nr:hypothetical protein BS47DRAFT_1302591 [Hydnum rufescens UP504]
MLSFTSAKEMHAQTEKAMVQGPIWTSQIITLKEAEDELQVMFFHNPVQCVKELLGNPAFAGEMDYEASKVFTVDRAMRIYHEMTTGKLWNETQDTLPAGATLAGIILSSDKTHLSVFSGNKVMHPVYMSLGNIQKHM